MTKEVAPPKLTSGDGFSFEDKVVAYYLACLLSGTGPFEPADGTIHRLQFQVRVDGWHLDDILVTLSGVGNPQCSISVKSNTQFSLSSAPKDFVRQIWEQFLHVNTTKFRRGQDSLALVTSALPHALLQNLTTLLNWARTMEPTDLAARIDVPGFASISRRRLFHSFECPPDLAAKYGIAPSKIGELLRHVLVLPFDFDELPSKMLREVHQLCRSALRSGDANEATALWHQLLVLASYLRPNAGEATLPRLLSKLRQEFDLKALPNHDQDWTQITRNLTENLESIPDTIGGKLSLERSSTLRELNKLIDEKRAIVVLGPSGSGKTVFAKQWATRQAGTWPILWLNSSTLSVPNVMSLERGLELRHSISDLFDATPASKAFIVVDGADRFYEEQLVIISRILSMVRLHDRDSPWSVILTCQPEEWARVQQHLMRHGVGTVDWGTILTQGFDEALLSQVWREFPALRSLGHRPELSELLSKPKVLDILATRLSCGKPIDTSQWIGESNLIEWFWDEEVHRKPGGAQRSKFLRLLAVKQAEKLRPEVPSDEFEAADLQHLDDLVADRLCRYHDEKISFHHDLLGDWARQRVLLARANELGQFLRTQGNSPMWNRAIRLYGLHLLERNNLSAWRKALSNLAAVENQLGQDLILESVIFASSSQSLLESLWVDLAANEGRLLKRLLRRFMFVATLPHPVILALITSTNYDLGAEASVRHRIPYVPLWLPMLRFLHAHFRDVTRLAPMMVPEVAEAWLRRGELNWPLRTEAAEIALEGIEYLEELRSLGVIFLEGCEKPLLSAALAGARELTQRVSSFALSAAGRKVDEGLDVAKPQRLWPDGPRTVINRCFQEVCLQTDSLVPLMRSSPATAREVLLALLIELPEDTQGWHSSYGVRDNLEIEEVIEWYPPMYWKGPFLQFLKVSWPEALDAIVRLVNFATARWGARWESHGRQPPNVLISTPVGPRNWVGDNQVYWWYHAQSHTPYTVAVALMALEKWMYERVDIGESLEEPLDFILKRSSSVAFAGVLSAVARRLPGLLQTKLRFLVEAPEFHLWEEPTEVDRLDIRMMGWARYDQHTIQLAKAWYEMPHRKIGLHRWGIKLFLSHDSMGQFFESTRHNWLQRARQLPSGSYLQQHLERLAMFYDPTLYHKEHDALGRDVWEFVPPSEVSEKAKQEIIVSSRHLRLLSFPIKCSNLIAHGDQSLSPEETWDVIQDALQVGESGSIGYETDDVVCAGAAYLILVHDNYLSCHPETMKYCQETIIKAAMNRPNDEAMTYRHEVHGLDAESFAAWALPKLWAKQLTDRHLRQAIALLATRSRYQTVKFLFFSASLLREQLAANFLQLRHLVLKNAILQAVAQDLNRTVLYGSYLERVWAWRQRRRAKRELDRLIIAFCDQIIEASVPKLAEQVSHQDTPPAKRRQRPVTIDFSLVKASHEWLPDLTQALDQREREGWVIFWIDLLQVVLKAGGNGSAEDEEIGRTPNEFDLWVLDRVAQVIAQLRPVEQPERLWKPILSLGMSRHYWVEFFLIQWANQVVTSPTTTVSEWARMIDFGFSSPIWKFETDWHRHYLQSMWLHLLGFGGSQLAVWDESLSGVALSLQRQYTRWAVKHVAQPYYALGFSRFLQRPAARPLRLEGLVLLAGAAPNPDHRFWKESNLQEEMATLLLSCWGEQSDFLRRHEFAFDAFRLLLKRLADLQNPLAMHLQESVSKPGNHT